MILGKNVKPPVSDFSGTQDDVINPWLYQCHYFFIYIKRRALSFIHTKLELTATILPTIPTLELNSLGTPLNQHLELHSSGLAGTSPAWEALRLLAPILASCSSIGQPPPLFYKTLSSQHLCTHEVQIIHPTPFLSMKTKQVPHFPQEP
jgi:hypothetical protein